jgi:carbonic anhydrase
LFNHSHASRRDFLRSAGIAAGTGGLSLVSLTRAVADDKEQTVDRKPDAVLGRLMDGNKRFVEGASTRLGRTPQDFAEDAKGQAPLATIIGCADSRVPPELVFDQNVGDLFVVRVAGNVFTGAGPIVKGSVEFSVAELGVRLIMVLGHSQCGAVAAAIAHIDGTDSLPGAIGGLVDLVRPAALAAKGKPGDKLANVIRANVERCVARVKGTDPILAKMVDKGDLRVVGGVYELSTGKVEIVA